MVFASSRKSRVGFPAFMVSGDLLACSCSLRQKNIFLQKSTGRLPIWKVLVCSTEVGGGVVHVAVFKVGSLVGGFLKASLRLNPRSLPTAAAYGRPLAQGQSVAAPRDGLRDAHPCICIHASSGQSFYEYLLIPQCARH